MVASEYPGLGDPFQLSVDVFVSAVEAFVERKERERDALEGIG